MILGKTELKLRYEEVLSDIYSRNTAIHISYNEVK